MLYTNYVICIINIKGIHIIREREMQMPSTHTHVCISIIKEFLFVCLFVVQVKKKL